MNNNLKIEIELRGRVEHKKGNVGNASEAIPSLRMFSKETTMTMEILKNAPKKYVDEELN